MTNLKTLLAAATKQASSASAILAKAKALNRLRDRTPELALLATDQAAEIERLTEALEEARPYVEQAGFRHHDVTDLLAKIDAALNNISEQGEG